MTTLIALDIGGANLKAARPDGVTRHRSFALWQQPAGLADELRTLLAGLGGASQLAVTMTGELCDCYRTRAAGVAAILAAVEQAAPTAEVHVWLVDGRLADLPTARAAPLLAAASNWHALATFAGRFAPQGPALLVDIGSTTADLIPLAAGVPQTLGRDDPSRLVAGELVYTGVRRTPICALVSGVCAELFATSADAHVLLGHLPEDAADHHTADGRPLTAESAHGRLARMLGGDSATIPLESTRQLAKAARTAQMTLLRQAATRQPRPATVITSGTGEWLARLALAEMFGDVMWVSLCERLGADASAAACAVALARLASGT